MKTICPLVPVIASAVLTVSCIKEIDTNEPVVAINGNEFTGTFESVKTTLEDYTPKWVAGDAIGISTDMDANVRCSIKDVEKGLFDADGVTGDAPFRAVYPFDAGNCFDGDILTAYVPSTQKLVSGSPVAPGALVAACRSGDRNLAFRNCVALLKITIPESDVARVDVTTAYSGGQKIAGKFTMDLSEETPTPIASAESGGTTVSLYPAGETFEAGSYYIAVIPAKLSSFEILFTNTEDNYVSVTGSATLDLKRSVCTDLGSFFTCSISTPAQMIKWARQSAKFTIWDKVTLEDDINFTAEEAARYVEAKNFCGVFDGQNHKITGLTTAVFSTLQGTVKNLELESDIVVKSGETVQAAGILARCCKDELSADSPCVENVVTRGSIRICGASAADICQVGGLAGESSGISVKNCRNYASVDVDAVTLSQDGSLYAGGCIGSANYAYGACHKLENYGNVTIGGSLGGQVKKLCAGGIVACASGKLNITGCSNWGNITNSAAGSVEEADLGGIIGRTDYSGSKIDACTVRCNVSNTGTATNCYAASVIGLCNTNFDFTLSNTRFAGSIAGSTVTRTNGTVTEENYEDHISAKKLNDTPYTGLYTCSCLDTDDAFDSGGALSTGTYNVLNSTGRDKCPENTWIAARASIAAIILNMNCDIMTINELGSTEIKYLQSCLSGYAFVTKPNTAKGTYSYAPGIIYRSSRLEKLSDGIFWLSDPDAAKLVTSPASYSYTDPKDGTVYSASAMRCCVWAHFRDLCNGRTFYWFATHPHVRGDDSASSLYNTIYSLNSGNIRSLLKQIPYVNTEGEAMVVAGDMNSWSGYVSYSLFAKAGLVNAFDAAVISGTADAETSEKPGTGPGYVPASYSYVESKRIDHIFFSGFSVGSCRNDYSRYYNPSEALARHPSDHIPVKAKLVNPTGETFENEYFVW